MDVVLGVVSIEPPLPSLFVLMQTGGHRGGEKGGGGSFNHRHPRCAYDSPRRAKNIGHCKGRSKKPARHTHLEAADEFSPARALRSPGALNVLVLGIADM